MTQHKLATGFDFQALRRAVEQGDAQMLADLYAEDVEARIVNRNSPPSSPFMLRGRVAIFEYLRDALGPGAANLATKCATHSGTRAVGQTEDHRATARIPYVKPGPRDGCPPRCNLLHVEPSARRIVARIVRTVRF